jgi:hypothetical protein
MLKLEGDHLLREPLEHLRAEEFDIERLLRSKLGIVERTAARKPPQPTHAEMLHGQARSPD